MNLKLPNITLNYNIMYRRFFAPLFSGPLVFSMILVLGTSCTPRTTLNTAASAKIVLDPVKSGDVDVTYKRSTVELEKKSFGGLMLGTNPIGAERTAIIDFHNGSRQGTVSQSGLNALVVLTCFSAWYGIATGLTDVIDGIQHPGALPRGSMRKDAMIFALPIALIGNESGWRLFNSGRLRSFGQQSLIDQEKGDFYSLPNESVSLKKGIFSTSWEYKGDMLSGTYSIKDKGQ